MQHHQHILMLHPGLCPRLLHRPLLHLLHPHTLLQNSRSPWNAMRHWVIARRSPWIGTTSWLRTTRPRLHQRLYPRPSKRKMTMPATFPRLGCRSTLQKGAPILCKISICRLVSVHLDAIANITHSLDRTQSTVFIPLRGAASGGPE